MVAYGAYGAAIRNITTYGRGGRRVTSVGNAALAHALCVVLLGLAVVGFSALAFIESAHA